MKWILTNNSTPKPVITLTMNSLLLSSNTTLPLTKPMSASLKRYYNNREEILEKNRLTPFYISNADFYIVLNHIKNICNYFFIKLI